ncbi:methyltransferase [Actinomadura montaniterrae]|uniref:Methyltransferase n=1 Tax=Actinomadura montaniterrae TaxID=1803903 RepID=A0A6L3W6L2_9ACTN|nr:methyltransferase [Actinomadura montaniterrae]KAB2390048.1 methyltransferase [Actinomadura montaniterrae]
MAPTDGAPLDRQAVARLNTAYAQSRILHSAVQVGLFELLEREPATLAVICERLDLNPALTGDFLNALVALGLLERAGGGRYGNSASASRFLVPGGDIYMGARVRTTAEKHYHLWGRLTEALVDGLPKSGGGAGSFDTLYDDPERARGFLKHMDANNALVAPQLADAVDWAAYGSFIDVGGARGNVAGTLVKAHPHLSGGVFELPKAEPFFHELMDELGLTGKVDFHPGDFFTDPLPAADVLVFGHVLHDWSVERRRMLLGRAFESLAPGGAIVVYDQMLDGDDPDLASLIGSLNVGLMLGGSEYTAEECRGWAEEAGFRVQYAERLPKGNDTVLYATKD